MSSESLVKDSNQICYTDNMLTIQNSNNQNEQISHKFPKLPIQFNTIYNDINKQQQYQICRYCNCNLKGDDSDSVQPDYELCPHMQNLEFKTFYEELPLRLAHLDSVNPVSIQNIKKNLFLKALSMLEPCELQQTQNTVSSIPQAQCHIYKDLYNMFPVQWESHFDPVVKIDNSKRNGRIMILVSFVASFVLLTVNLIAMLISNSMSILVTVMDLFLDIISGIILIVSIKRTRFGIQPGKYQQTLYHNNPTNIQFVFAQRYESLGVLSYSCIKGICSVILASKCFSQILRVISGMSDDVVFGYIPMGIVIFTIFLKLSICIGCHIAAKQNPLEQDAILAYRDDSRNDVMSNSLVLISAMLSSNLKGMWGLCDPIFSIMISIYIFLNWTGSAINQMKQLSGHVEEEKIVEDLLMRLIHQFRPDIKEVQSFIGYQSGQQTVLEMTLKVNDNTTLQEARTLSLYIQSCYEGELGIERCHVQVEGESHTNEF
ncbi:Cation_efflux family protein [Hexamita inflata]|uniref:Cation efflux family protein n=2 Tax=Hexamita inflata TaxID=28002 RepID=A0AA86TKA2_9EUKA|nr:Cation efflux family protein [Hexamita inflata]CAI9946553.1 Cation efflux family protein [Hexamita inflata]CAI9947676.1 Cation efflux family protein [Hexamita inflata]